MYNHNFFFFLIKIKYQINASPSCAFSSIPLLPVPFDAYIYTKGWMILLYNFLLYIESNDFVRNTNSQPLQFT